MLKYRFTLLITFSALFCQAQDLIEKQFLLSYSTTDIRNATGFIASNDVDVFKILYTSNDLKGEKDTLSGILVTPSTENTLHPMVVYCHGTVSNRDAVPSRLSAEHFLAVLFGGLGYNTIAPDFLGLGDSRGIHPYVHADSEASASYDMLLAVTENADDIDLKYNGQNFLTGYSQGGHASMALHRLMEGGENDLEVTAAAHLSGPYSISEEMMDFTIGDMEYRNADFIILTMLMLEEAYGVLDGKGLESVFRPEFMPAINTFLESNYDRIELGNNLRTVMQETYGNFLVKNLLTDSAFNDIRNNRESELFKALADNDVYDWTPQAPTRLYYCQGDDIVVYTNSIVAENKMVENGSTMVQSSNLGDESSHSECIAPALTLTVFYFESFKNLVSNTEDIALDYGVKVFPNPAINQFSIISDELVTGRLRMYDPAGRIVVDRPFTSNEIMDVSGLNQGFYFLQWKTDSFIYSDRIIVSN